MTHLIELVLRDCETYVCGCVTCLPAPSSFPPRPRPHQECLAGEKAEPLLPGVSHRLPPAGTAVHVTPRSAALAAVLEPLHVTVLGLSDALRAVTLTANRGAIRAAERQGVALDAVLHRAVWLTGM